MYVLKCFHNIDFYFKNVFIVNSQVRQAWYTLLHSILSKLQRFLQDECKKVAFAVFDNVDEENVTVSCIIWKNILIVLSKPEVLIIH